MNRSCQWLLIVTVLSGALVALASTHVDAALKHPNHVTLAEIEFNPKTGNFEIALCVHPEDLEKMLERFHKVADAEAAFQLNKSTIDRYASKWLSNEFVVKAEGSEPKKVLPIRWVGCELDVKKAWLFFEVTGADALRKFELENKLFLKQNDDQTNHVKLKHGRELKWFQFTSKQSKILFEL